MLAVVLLGSGSCGYLGMVQRQRAIRVEQALGAGPEGACRLEPTSCYYVIGRLDGGRAWESYRVRAVPRDGLGQQRVVEQQTRRGDRYAMLLPAGRYDLFALRETDDDAEGPVGEALEPVIVSREIYGREFVVRGPSIVMDEQRVAKGPPWSTWAGDSGCLTGTLNEEIFERRHGAEGLYDPSKFLSRTQAILFTLEPFAADRIPVLFVHGIGGTPRDFSYLLDGIDRSVYQPWFFYYPSGLPLDALSHALAMQLPSMGRGDRGSTGEVIVIAHSMGGLVARGTLIELRTSGRATNVGMLITASTPYGGDEAAGIAVDLEVEMVSSWRDLAPDSPFLERLRENRLPLEVQFELLFAYRNDSVIDLGPNDDGTVTLRSQLPPWVQEEAQHVYGFDETHDGLLVSAEVRRRIVDLLKAHRMRTPGTGGGEPSSRDDLT